MERTVLIECELIQINNFLKCFRFVWEKKRHLKGSSCGRRKQFVMAKWNACLKTGRNESTYERLILHAIQTQ